MRPRRSRRITAVRSLFLSGARGHSGAPFGITICNPLEGQSGRRCALTHLRTLPRTEPAPASTFVWPAIDGVEGVGCTRDASPWRSPRNGEAVHDDRSVDDAAGR